MNSASTAQGDVGQSRLGPRNGETARENVVTELVRPLKHAIEWDVPLEGLLEEALRRVEEERALQASSVEERPLPPDPPTEVVPGLWQGGYPVDLEWAHEEGVTAVCDLADPGLAPRGSTAGLFYLKGALVDGHGRLDEEYLTTLARIFADQHRRGRKVLVHCAWGRNRSGLVTALVVRELLGVSGAEAVKIVQSRRRRALNNETFKAFVDALPAPAAH